ncbi:hypothetical protein GCM10028798_09820 [Humibacter antri]
MSATNSAARIAATLSIPCPVCGTPPDQYCNPPVAGFCGARWDLGVALAGAQAAREQRPPVELGELASRAGAVRNVELHHAQNRHRRTYTRHVPEES